MKSNELKEHIQRLNAQEKIEHEFRRQKALNKIKQLREQLRSKEHQRVTPLL